jgi:hypothetical protein
MRSSRLSRQFRVAITIASCVLSLTACGPSTGERAASEEGERGALAAFLHATVGGSPRDTVLLLDSALVYELPGPESVPEWRAQFDSIPAELTRKLAAASTPRRLVARTHFPRPLRTLSERDLAELFAADGRDGWQRFAERYPRHRSFLSMSPIVLSDDGRSALLYYEVHCGSLCGSGNLLWLMRTDDGQWQVKRSLLHWIS